jgi:hypothetical protein
MTRFVLDVVITFLLVTRLPSNDAPLSFDEPLTRTFPLEASVCRRENDVRRGIFEGYLAESC